MPSASTHRRRNSKQSSVSSKKPSQSVISSVSHESTSSSATARPYSIFPSSLRPSRRPGARKDTPERLTIEHRPAKEAEEPVRENVNVFAYMQKDEDDISEDESEEEKVEAAELHQAAFSATSSSASSLHQPLPSPTRAGLPQRSPRYSDLEVRAIQHGIPNTWARASLHSDSGISDMRSSSPDAESPTLQHKLPTVYDVPSTEVDPSYEGSYGRIDASPNLREERDDVFSHKHWPSLEINQCPETCYAPSPPRLTQIPYNPSYVIPEPCAHSTQLIRNETSTHKSQLEAKKGGYNLLASNIDSNDPAFLKPIYRKFEMLNNRMLLYLQDEIAEMEDQLKELDDLIAHEVQSSGQRPASRRTEAKFPSQLQWHRMELLGRSFAKVEQYSESISNVLSDL